MTVGCRDCVSDVVELPDERPVLVGRIPLERLDCVADMESHRPVGNPARGGEHNIELY